MFISNTKSRVMPTKKADMIGSVYRASSCLASALVMSVRSESTP